MQLVRDQMSKDFMRIQLSKILFMFLKLPCDSSYKSPISGIIVFEDVYFFAIVNLREKPMACL